MLGEHLLIDFKCDTNTHMDDINKLYEIFDELIETSHLSKIESMDYKFTPQGVSIIVMLKESHISIHTWPELNICTMDIYVCSTNIDVKNVTKILGKYFEIKESNVQLIKRGI